MELFGVCDAVSSDSSQHSSALCPLWNVAFVVSAEPVPGPNRRHIANATADVIIRTYDRIVDDITVVRAFMGLHEVANYRPPPRPARQASMATSADWDGPDDSYHHPALIIPPTARVAAVRVQHSGAPDRGSTRTVQITRIGDCAVYRVLRDRLESIPVMRTDWDLTRLMYVPPDMTHWRIPIAAFWENVELSVGDELLLTSSELLQSIPNTMHVKLCNLGIPLVTRATMLSAYLRNQKQDYTFAFVRLVKPPPQVQKKQRYTIINPNDPFASGTPSLPYPAPENGWESSRGALSQFSLNHDPAQRLDMFVNWHPSSLVPMAFLRACQWAIESIASRFATVPPRLATLLNAFEHAKTPGDWEGDAQARVEPCLYWLEQHVGIHAASVMSLSRLLRRLASLSQWPAQKTELVTMFDDLARVVMEICNQVGDFDTRPKHRLESRAAYLTLIDILVGVAPEPWNLKQSAPPEQLR